ncbi:MAG: glycoside hydrolase domain-containing protein [Oligosphaeraceae bacterium]
MKKSLLCLLCLALVPALPAVDAFLEIPRATVVPVIDGNLAGDEWRDAVELTGLQLTNDRGLAREQTRYFLKWTPDFLYVGAFCQDANPAVLDPARPYNDCLELFLMAPGEQDVVHWLFYATGGSTLDYIDAEYGSGYRGERGEVESATQVGEKGWSLECRIPARSFFLDFFPDKYLYRMNLHRCFSDNGTHRTDGRPAEFSSFRYIRGQLLKPRDAAWMRLGAAAETPLRLKRLDARGMALEAPQDAQVLVASPGNVQVVPPSPEGGFALDFPEGCPEVTLRVLRKDGTPLLANDYRFFPGDDARREEARRVQAAQTGLGVDVRGAMTRVFQDLPYASQGAGSVALTAAKNEQENFQVVLFTGKEPVEGVTLEMEELKGEDGAVLPPSLWQLFLEEDAVADSVGYPNVRGAGLYPDPLHPLAQPLSLEPMSVRRVWASLRVPEECAAGTYTGSLVVRRQGEVCRRISVSCRVWDFSLPRRQSMRSAFAIWEREIYNLHFAGTDRTAEEFAQTIHKYALMLLEHRLSPIVFKTDRLLPREVVEKVGPVYDDKQEDGTYVYHPHGYDAMVEEYLAGGATGFYVGPEVTPGEYGKYTDQEWFQLWKAIGDHYREKGLLEYAYAYPFDEPGNENREFVSRRMEILKEAAPGLKTLLTGACSLMPSTKFRGVDIWVPQLHWVHYRNMREAQDEGKEVWWYPCSGPWYPYPNYHLDLPPAAWRILAWATFKYNFDGILYWATAFLNNQDPRRNNNYSCNGDGVLMYDLPDGSPIPSIRLKVIADSMEDYEYLVLLKKCVAKHQDNPEMAPLVEKARDLLAMKEIFRYLDDYALEEDAYQSFRQDAGEVLQKMLR